MQDELVGVEGLGSVGSVARIIVLEKEEVQRFIPCFSNGIKLAMIKINNSINLS
ncbi:MAG: hypothetical protein AB4080_25225 [Trichodesmium sp.]